MNTYRGILATMCLSLAVVQSSFLIMLLALTVPDGIADTFWRRLTIRASHLRSEVLSGRLQSRIQGYL
jgi:hypothetical protein